ncbi:ABC transporter substrate-binding protein [Martelella alba]|uniref:ABC transporter substrate-binding protein n=2 Tax=Martelella alba TaxID=2590451 RepID=A0A506U0Q7_9HYPH|nr:ABC transporter substrate-binding protein [Martelella alba]
MKRRTFVTLSILAPLGATLPLGGIAARAEEERPDFTFAVDNLWPTLDPVIGISTTGGRVYGNVFDTLIRRDYDKDPEGNEIVPWLAESWERTTPTVWTVHLRKGVKFQNGDEMTAEDVAFSLSAERLWGDQPLAPRGKNYARGIVRVDAIDDYTVEIETEFPDSTFINRMTTPIGYVLPKKYYEKVGTDAFGQKPIGTGPYMVTDFDPSDHATTVAFDDYWAGKPPLKGVTFKIVPEYSTRLAGLAAGDYDMIVSIPVDQMDQVRSMSGVELIVTQIGNYPMAAFNTLTIDGMDDNPLADPNLRKAMVMAVDRPAITKALWGDLTFTPAPFDFPEYGPYYDPDRKPEYGYDPDRAKEFLAKTSYKGEPLIWNIVRGFYPNYEEAAEYMVEMWRDLGINVELNVVDNFSLAYKRPFHLLNMSMSSEFTGDPYRPLWLDWGPSSSRVTASHRTWVPSEAFLKDGETFERGQTFEEKDKAYLDLVKDWEDVTPGMYLWRNVQSFAISDKYEWNPGTSQLTIFDNTFMKVN